MRKNSSAARRIHTLMHTMLQAIEGGDAQRRNRALVHALDIHELDIRKGGGGYSLLWLTEIAEQHPAALTASPDLAVFLDEYRTQRRAYIRGKRDHAGNRVGNPYCAYTSQLAHDAWSVAWDDAAMADTVAN